jgi:cbb3-type cytochrome oxidase subunit 3
VLAAPILVTAQLGVGTIIIALVLLADVVWALWQSKREVIMPEASDELQKVKVADKLYE